MFHICSFTQDDLSAWAIMLSYFTVCFLLPWYPKCCRTSPNTTDDARYSWSIFIGWSTPQRILLYHSWIVQMWLKEKCILVLDSWWTTSAFSDGPAICIMWCCNILGPQLIISLMAKVFFKKYLILKMKFRFESLLSEVMLYSSWKLFQKALWESVSICRTDNEKVTARKELIGCDCLRVRCTIQPSIHFPYLSCSRLQGRQLVSWFHKATGCQIKRRY